MTLWARITPLARMTLWTRMTPWAPMRKPAR